MEVGSFLSALMTFLLLRGFNCTEDIELLNDRWEILYNGIQLLSNRFDVFESQIPIEKAILMNKQEEKILSLKTELKTNIRQHVTEALSEILRGESLKDMIKSQVISEVRHLQRAHHQMRREVHQMKKSLDQVQADCMFHKEPFHKGERKDTELTKYLVKSELLTAQLAERDRAISELKEELREQHELRSSSNYTNTRETDTATECSKWFYSEIVTNRLIKHEQHINELNQTFIALCKGSNNIVNKESDSVSETSTTLTSTTAEATASTTRLTTTEPQPERSRILVAPLWSSTPHRFRRVDIHSSSIDIYSFLKLRYIYSVVYISKLNSLLIGFYNPGKIITSTLDITRVRTVRHNVGTYGMAVDEKLGVVFLTTFHPRWTISRMSLQGKNFTALVYLYGYGSYPRGISVHPDRQVIYACNEHKLFSARYDGTGLTTLNTGNFIYAVSLDINYGLLYYGKETKLMKMSLSTNTSSEVTEFGFHIWNLIYYRDTVYYISYSSPYGTLGAVDVGQNIMSYIQTVKVTGVNYYAICLIP